MANEKKSEDDKAVTVHEPDQTLRNLIGRDTKLAEVFTPDRIAASQQAIDNARNSFFETADEEVIQLEKLLTAYVNAPEMPLAVFEDLAVLAADIKEQADMFGYTLVSAISSHIIDCCEPDTRAPTVHFRLVEGLAKLLHIAIKQKITDDRGTLAQELKTSLKNY